MTQALQIVWQAAVRRAVAYAELRTICHGSLPPGWDHWRYAQCFHNLEFRKWRRKWVTSL
jgi:hypothetical protein